MKQIARIGLACALVWGVLGWQGAAAQQPPAPPPKQKISQQDQIAIEREAAFDAAKTVAKHGPVTVALGEQGSIEVPKGRVFVPQPEAGRVMRALGNSSAPDMLGVMWPSSEDDENWFATVRFVKSGYIKDGEAKEWKASELLQNLKEGTESANEERLTRGFPALEVIGWVERPDYDASSHSLVWSVNAKHKGVPASNDDTVNYNTYVLGRDGYFSLNFVTDMQSIAAEKPAARQFLSAMSFKPGKTYADYNAATDYAAEFGIGALIAGGAAKKLGLFAVIGVFIAKAGKLLIIPLIAGGAILRKVFGRNKDAA